MYVCVCVYVYVHVQVYVCVLNVCLFTCVYVYIYLHASVYVRFVTTRMYVKRVQVHIQVEKFLRRTPSK